MRVRRRTLAGGLALILGLAAAAPASAGVSRTVQAGDTLWSLAATEAGLTTGAIAAANGLDEDAPLAAGTTIELPTAEETAATGTPAEAVAPPAPSGSTSAGAYTVQPGDTLSAIAAAAGVGAEQLAAHNGLAADGIVIEGSVLELPAATDATGAETAEAVAPSTGATATAASISSTEIAQIAAEHGVPGDLAAAVAWQESGFSNGVVSPAGATGVMQILPSTWDWLQEDVSEEALDPASASDNVHAGVIFLGQLLAESGGDEATAVASYYQGASSVASEGIFSETQQYVDNVMALRSQFGG